MKQLLIYVLIVLSFAACGGGGASGGSGSAGLLPAASNAAAVASSTTSAMSATGTVEGISGSVFLLDSGSPHGDIDVSSTSSTTITGGTLALGETVQVTGTGSWSTSIAATSVAIESTVTSAAAPAPTLGPVIAAPSGVVSTSGTVAGLNSTEMLLNQGEPHGDIDVSIPSTALRIGTGATGSYALVTGTGSLSTSLKATVISYYSAAPQSTTVSGTIATGTSYGFTLNTGSVSLPIVVTPATVIGGATLQAGANAEVTGVGTSTTEITAVQIVVTDPATPAPATPTPGPISQTHILTSDYLAGNYGTTSVPYSEAAQYLTWAETTGADSTAIRATGIKTMLYTDPNRTQVGDEMYTSDASTFAQTCSGSDITIPYSSTVTQYIMNPASPDLEALYTQTIKNESAGTTFDAVFEDNVGPLELTGVSTMPCSYSDSSWLAAEANLASYSPYPVFINSLSALDGQNPSPTISMATAPNTLGAIYDGCYSDDNAPEYDGWVWQAVENTELEVTAEKSTFICIAEDNNAASSNVQSRIYTLASFLLTYNPASSVLWNEFATPSGLHVLPEEELVVENPTTPAPASISGLQTSSGAYGRQYEDCYLKGQFAGPCAIAVNPGAASVVFPYPQYTHTLTVSGAGVVDGGTVSTAGPSAGTSLAAESAVIAFP